MYCSDQGKYDNVSQGTQYCPIVFQKSSKGALYMHCNLVNYLLATCATDIVVADSVKCISNCTHMHNAKSFLYAQTVWDNLLRCGTVYNEAILKRIFMKGLRIDEFVNAHPFRLEKVIVNERTCSTGQFALCCWSWNAPSRAPPRWQTLLSIQDVSKIEMKRTHFVKCRIIVFRFWHAHDEQYKRCL